LSESLRNSSGSYVGIVLGGARVETREGGDAQRLDLRLELLGCHVARPPLDLTLFVDRIEFGVGGAMVGLVVEERAERETVALGRVFGRIAHNDGGDGCARIGKVEQFRDLAHRVERGAHVADPQPLRLEPQADRLRQDHRVEGRHVVPEQIVEIVARPAPAQPLARPVPVGAERDEQRRLQNHLLLEMEFVEAALPLRIARQDHGDAVEISGGGGAGDRVAADLLDQRGIDRIGSVTADRAVSVEQRREWRHGRQEHSVL